MEEKALETAAARTQNPIRLVKGLSKVVPPML